MAFIYINIILFIILTGGITYILKSIWSAQQQRLLQDALIEELKIVIESYSEYLNKNQKRKAEFDGTSYDLMDPVLLSSLMLM